MSWYDPTSWDTSGIPIVGPLLGSSPMPNVGGPNPYQGDWNTLIQQLRERSAGGGPSLAGDAYNTAYNQGENALAATSHSGRAGAAQMAATGGQNLTSQLASGYAKARNEEMIDNEDALSGALTGAGNAWLAPQQLELQKWAAQNGMDMSRLQAIASLFGTGASLFGDGKPKAGA